MSRPPSVSSVTPSETWTDAILDMDRVRRRRRRRRQDPAPWLVINSADLRTLPVGMALFKDPYGNINYGPLMAAAVISTGPMLVACAISQRFMIRGIALTGLKS